MGLPVENGIYTVGSVSFENRLLAQCNVQKGSKKWSALHTPYIIVRCLQTYLNPCCSDRYYPVSYPSQVVTHKNLLLSSFTSTSSA